MDPAALDRLELLAALAERERLLSAQAKLLAEQSAAIVELRAETAGLRAEVAQAREENQELRRRLEMNSQNSSKPPSSDGLAKPTRKQSRRGRSGRRPGKQPGASGSTLELVDDPDEVRVLGPNRCEGCGAGLAEAEVFAEQRRQVVDVPAPKAWVTEYRVQSCQCACGRVTTAAAPAAVASRVQYGPAVRAAALYLTAGHHLPVARGAEATAVLTGVTVSTGFVAGLRAEAAGRLGPFQDLLRDRLREAAVLHADETPARAAGGQKYVHVACTPELTGYHVGGRSGADIDAGKVLPGFTGVLVRDGYAAYQRYTDAEHAWCGAHLLRDLAGVHEANPDHQLWAAAMATTLLAAKRWAEQARAEGRDRLTDTQTRELRCRYRGAVAAGRDDNPDDGKRALGKARVLVDRFDAHETMILRFAADLSVPFDNNQAERDVRMIKLQQKVSGCWRTLHGLVDFALIRSYLSTAAKHGKNALDVLHQLFTTGPWLPPEAVPG